MQTQIELIRGPVVLSRLLAKSEIASLEEFKTQTDPLGYLSSNISVVQVGGSELFRISYIGPSASDAALIANTVLSEFLVMQDIEERKRAKISD